MSFPRPNRPQRVLAAAAVLALGVSTGCAMESIAAAERVPMPVIVGPVAQIGGEAEAPVTVPETAKKRQKKQSNEAMRGSVPGVAFEASVDNGFTVSSSSNGHTTVTHTQSWAHGHGLVDAKIRAATDGATDNLIRVDELDVITYCGSLLAGWWVNNRVRVRGHVDRRIPSLRRAAVDEGRAP